MDTLKDVLITSCVLGVLSTKLSMLACIYKPSCSEEREDRQSGLSGPRSWRPALYKSQQKGGRKGGTEGGERKGKKREKRAQREGREEFLPKLKITLSDLVLKLCTVFF